MRRWFSENIAAWAGIVVMAAIVATLWVNLGPARASQNQDQLVTVQRAIERAAVQCYALEGAYPPDVVYLEEKYGVVIDHSRYFIHYEVAGANLRPDVIVFPEEVTP